MNRMFVTLAFGRLVTGGSARSVTASVVTSSNNPAGNQLLVYGAAGVLLQAVSTNGL